jgi:hypothetical protein
MAHDVFISYAHEDRTVANAVVATRKAGASVAGFLPGISFREKIGAKRSLMLSRKPMP